MREKVKDEVEKKKEEKGGSRAKMNEESEGEL
jgi:hypothetical protein